MYFQITTRCNMSCAHCSFSCELGKPGEHMTKRTLANAIYFAKKVGDEYWAIGGGEPTMHPEFWDVFGRFMEAAQSNGANVWMATNGSLTKRALALANLASADRFESAFNITLSQDYYHDPIDSRVVNVFKAMNHDIRDVTRSGRGVTNIGAAEINGVGETDHCACQDIHISPNGDVRLCGCLEGPVVANVNKKIDYEVFSKHVDVVRDTHNECARYYEP